MTDRYSRSFLKLCLLFWLLSGMSGARSFCDDDDDMPAAKPPQTRADYLKLLRDKAQNGDVDAQLRLGLYYFNGKYCPANYVVAAMWFRKAAEQNNGVALYNLGICHERGLGMERNHYLAFKLFEKACEKGVYQANYNLALYYLSGIDEGKKKKTPAVKPNPQKAEQLLTELVDKKYIPAYPKLAALFIGRKDVPEEQKKHYVSLLKQAAARGNSDAMRMIADCHYLGWGCSRDDGQTLLWLRKAAEHKNLEALAKLAYCYEYGEGTKPDPKMAFKLYKMAADKGHPLAQTKMGDYYSSGKFVKQDIDTALQWYKKAADQDNAQAWFQLGIFASDGIGMNKSDLKATECFLKSAVLGYPRAQFNLACYLLEGRGIREPRPKAAFFWFKQAAMQNDARAQKRLAFCYFQGVGTKKDARKGLAWLGKSAENGDKEAQTLLMQMK